MVIGGGIAYCVVLSDAGNMALMCPHEHVAGNTCFINSILQVLYRTPGFVDFVSDVAIQVQLATALTSLSNHVSCFVVFVNTEQDLFHLLDSELN